MLFFAAVEERDRPWLAGRPIVVGADPAGGKGRGVVSTANYAARKYGIHSALPISTAWRFAEEAKRRGEPETVFLRGSWGRYSAVSRHVMEIIHTHSTAVEVASVDEAYFDLSHLGSYAKATEEAGKLKQEIFREERITASVGIGPNKLIAKLASGKNKPDGLTIISPAALDGFLEPLFVREIPGIGPRAEKILEERGVKTVTDAKKLSREKLVSLFGVWGSRLHEKLRGIDTSPLVLEREVKSVGEQETFEKDTLDSGMLFGALGVMCENVAREVQQAGFAGWRTVTISVRFSDFSTYTRAHTSKKLLVSHKELFVEATRLFTPFLDQRENPHRKKIRLIGVRVSRLDK